MHRDRTTAKTGKGTDGQGVNLLGLDRSIYRSDSSSAESCQVFDGKEEAQPVTLSYSDTEGVVGSRKVMEVRL